MQVKGLAVGAVALAMAGWPARAQQAAPPAPDTAAALAQAFGARDQIQQVSLSPDGKKVAIVTPFGTRGEALMIADPFAGGEPVTILHTNGEREQLEACS